MPSRKHALARRPLNFLRLSKIDQHPAPGAAQTTPSPLRQWHFIGDREFGSAPAAFHGRHLLPDPQTPAPIASRGGAASLSQMPVAHGSPASCRSSSRL